MHIPQAVQGAHSHLQDKGREGEGRISTAGVHKLIHNSRRSGTSLTKLCILQGEQSEMDGDARVYS